MRAKILETGEVVDVKYHAPSCLYMNTEPTCNGNVFKTYHLHELEFEPTKEIDWEQRRYDLFKDFCLSSASWLNSGIIDYEFCFRKANEIIYMLKNNPMP